MKEYTPRCLHGRAYLPPAKVAPHHARDGCAAAAVWPSAGGAGGRRLGVQTLGLLEYVVHAIDALRTLRDAARAHILPTEVPVSHAISVVLDVYDTTAGVSLPGCAVRAGASSTHRCISRADSTFGTGVELRVAGASMIHPMPMALIAAPIATVGLMVGAAMSVWCETV